MKVIRVRLREKGYDIVVGNNILASLGHFLKRVDCRDNAVVITNPVIKNIWGKRFLRLLRQGDINVALEEVADTEKSKSIQSCLGLLNRIARFGRSRRLFIVAFGGGVVGDVGGFVASIYKRGVPYIQVPTTLLAQVDSAIGGKVAIDLKLGKNLVGAFYQPRLVFSETAFLETLPKRQLVNGLSEVIKYGVIKDKGLFEVLENNLDRLFRVEKKSIEYIVAASSRLKARFVEQDEFDKRGIRMVLNYGHTIGHAIEAACGYSKRYTHGEAIGIGMTAANFISKELGLILESEAKRIENLLKKTGLPTRARGVSAADIYAAHLYDKKFTNRKNRFVLPLCIGKARIVEDIPEKLVKRAIDAICGLEK